MFAVKNVSEKMRELLTDENTEVYSNPTIRVKLESMSHDIYTQGVQTITGHSLYLQRLC